MARKNPYDAPVPGTLKPDDSTEVAMSTQGTVLPVDDETNFGPLKGRGKGELAPEALAMDPRALAQKLAAQAGRLPPTRTPTPRSRRLRPDRRRTPMLEDEPTQLGDPTIPPAPRMAVEKIDPRELARKLAAEAKERIKKEEAAKAKAEPSETPAELARRLATEAKARILAQQQAEAPQEDPAAMARRLAKETKARLAAQAEAEAAEIEARAKEERKAKAAAKAAADAKAEAEQAARVEAEARAAEEAARAEAAEAEAQAEAREEAEKNAAKPRGGLASRAPRTKAKKSALEALKALDEVPEPEPVAEAEPERSDPEPEVEAVVEEAAEPVEPEVVLAAPVPARPKRKKRVKAKEPTGPAYLAGLVELLPDAVIERERPVLKPGVFKALWEAHQVRAVKDNQLELAMAAHTLLCRAAERSAGDLIGIQLSHQGTSWAAFVDRTDGSVLAIVPRPAIYLAGLQ